MAENDDEQKKKDEDAAQRSSPSGEVVYKAICEEGSSELERTTAALFWSGLAAGLSMGFSFVASGMLHAHLPHASWTPLVTSLGYTVGFVIVILGRQQLFTENTLTVILPLLTRRDMKTLMNVLRLWSVVLAANVIGAILFAFVIAKTQAVNGDVYEALKTLAHEAQGTAFLTTMLKGVFAGWLIALVVWLMPFAESAHFFMIVMITYVVGLAGFAHVIAGSTDAVFLVFAGESRWSDFLLGFFVPSLLGNILGGVTLVAVINHAQVVAGGGGTDV